MSETSDDSPYGDRTPSDWWFNALMDPRDVNPPTGDQIIGKLMLTGEMFTPDFDRFKYLLDRIAPVRGTFEITETPPGYPPDDIRRKWVGLTLPIRGFFEPQYGVEIIAREAMEQLREGSPEAYSWWQERYADEAKVRMPHIDAEGYPEFLANISHLVFNQYCGEPRLLTNAPIVNEQRDITDI